MAARVACYMLWGAPQAEKLPGAFQDDITAPAAVAARRTGVLACSPRRVRGARAIVVEVLCMLACRTMAWVVHATRVGSAIGMERMTGCDSCCSGEWVHTLGAALSGSLKVIQ